MKFRGGYLERNHILIVEFNPSFGHEHIQAYASLTEGPLKLYVDRQMYTEGWSM